MMTPAERKRKERATKKKAGLVWFGAWIKPGWAKRIQKFIEQLGA